MRLICPNCTAQYEVGDDVIPDGGRDVQCSNCGHTWFERPPHRPEAADPATPDTAAATKAPASDQHDRPEPKGAPDPDTAKKPAPRPRDLDPDVAGILREEAQFEKSAREAKANPIEIQEDLDLSQDPVIPEADRKRGTQNSEHDDIREALERRARLRTRPEVKTARTTTVPKEDVAPASEPHLRVEEATAPAASPARMSSAGTAPEAAPPEATPPEATPDDEAQRTGSGFARGFTIMVVLALLALAIYVFAPQISAAMPQAAQVLTEYVDWVDGARIWLDGQVQGLIGQ